jgi:hypothetical protein
MTLTQVSQVPSCSINIRRLQSPREARKQVSVRATVLDAGFTQ